MITDAAAASRRTVPLTGIAAALAIWFAGMTAAALVVRPNAVVAFGDPARLSHAVMSGNAALLNAGPGFLAVRPATDATVRELYAGGAWLVWPVLSAGCFKGWR